jgi:hypothetical protein
MDRVITWLENHQVPCIYKSILGIDCPGCGLQRAFIELLKGNLSESFRIYPPLFPVLILFMLLILQLVFRFRKGGLILKTWALVTGGIMIVSYIAEIIIEH